MTLRFLLVFLTLAMLACSSERAPGGDEIFQRQVQEYDAQTRKVAEQQAVTDQQLKKAEEQAERTDKLLERQEKQADRYDALLDTWEKQGRR